MPRVLEVLGASAGGIARHVADITEALDGRHGLSIDVACPPGLPIEMPRRALALSIPSGWRGHGRAILRLRRIIQEGGYDIVHAHGLRAGIDSAIAAGRIPVIVTVHNLVHPEIAGKRAAVDRWAEPLVVKLSRRTLAVSQEIADHLKASAPRSSHKIDVLYLGVGDPPEVTRPREEVREELGVAAGRCLVVSVARLAPQKALHVLLDAISRTSTSPVVAIVGEGPLESRLRGQAARLGLVDQVRFLGFRADATDVVAAADVFCLSSIWEGVPLSVQEAIQLRVPVVSTDVGGMREIVVDRRSGRLVASGDASALAQAIDEVCSGRDVADRYVARAATDLGARFSTERMLATLERLYRGSLDAS